MKSLYIKFITIKFLKNLLKNELNEIIIFVLKIIIYQITMKISKLKKKN